MTIIVFDLTAVANFEQTEHPMCKTLHSQILCRKHVGLTTAALDVGMHGVPIPISFHPKENEPVKRIFVQIVEKILYRLQVQCCCFLVFSKHDSLHCTHI